MLMRSHGLKLVMQDWNKASYESLIEVRHYVLCIENKRPQGNKVLYKIVNGIELCCASIIEFIDELVINHKLLPINYINITSNRYCKSMPVLEKEISKLCLAEICRKKRAETRSYEK